MKKLANKILLSIAILWAWTSKAQVNLVPNPSFEVYNSCPNNQGQIFKVTNWINYGGTPDYFNACASIGTGQSVPKNWGFQFPSSGNGYIDLASYENVSPNLREYAATQLAMPLNIGTKYFVSFKVTPVFNTSYINLFTNNLGLLFTTYKFDSLNPPIINFSHLRANNIISDTTNWVQITGDFIADSSYLYAILGNFYDSNNTLIDSTTFISSGFRGAYYYYDDIIVTTDSSLIFEVNDLDGNREMNFEIYPNPTEGVFYFNTNSIEGGIVSIYSCIGDLKGKSKVSSKEKMDFSFLEDGIYTLEFLYSTMRSRKLLIINH